MTETYYETPAAASPGLMQRATAILPMARYARFVPKNPWFLGAAALGIAGALAWKNREKIRRVAGPALQNAADRARPMLETARERMPSTRATGTPAGMQETLQ